MEKQQHIPRAELAPIPRPRPRRNGFLGLTVVTLLCSALALTRHQWPGFWPRWSPADPVTPLRNAMDNAKRFEGAVALTQDSGGHCSLAAYSECTVRYIRRYFQSGELPERDTICEADEVPFGDGDESIEAVEVVEAKKRQARFHAALKMAGGWGLGAGEERW